MLIDNPISLKLPSHGCFIAIEGVNGAGKSTLQRGILEILSKRGMNAIATREPGGTKLGLALRKILQESPELNLSPYAELFLFSADRREHVEKVIRPALASGTCVVTDRYFYSSWAFQGFGRGLPEADVVAICEKAVDGLKPDLTILLDLEPSEGLRRGKGRTVGQDTFEMESIEFHNRIRDGFLEIAKKTKEPFLVLDARVPSEETMKKVGIFINRAFDERTDSRT